jgi:hypothetical protein
VDFATIKQVLSAFEREGVRYAIFGDAALNLHGLARFTEDLDEGERYLTVNRGLFLKASYLKRF